MADIICVAFSIKSGCSAIRFRNTGIADANNVLVMCSLAREGAWPHCAASFQPLSGAGSARKLMGYAVAMSF